MTLIVAVKPPTLANRGNAPGTHGVKPPRRLQRVRQRRAQRVGALAPQRVGERLRDRRARLAAPAPPRGLGR